MKHKREDNVSLLKEVVLPRYVTDLGVPIKNTQLLTGVIGKDVDGQDVLYSVLTGEPAVFVVVDVNTNQTLKEYPLIGVAGSWAVLQASDGTVYLGGYNSPYLYRYDPANDRLENLGRPPEISNMIYTMSESKSGRIYGGSYSPGHIWEYNPATGKFTDLGIPVADSDYVRSTAYNPDADKLYAGTGTRAGIVEYDLSNPNYATDPNARRDILPLEFRYGQPHNIEFAYDLNYVDGKLFVKMKDTRFQMIVLDVASGQAINAINADTGASGVDITATSRGVSPKSPLANRIYFSNGGLLYSYDLDTDTYTIVEDKNSHPVSVGDHALNYSFIMLKDPDFPGYSLVGLSGNRGSMFKYNLQTGNVKIEPLSLPAQSIIINNIINGPDGKIYTNGYFSGGVSAYSPSAGTSERVPGIGQADGVAVLGNSIWFGIYPAARFVEYPVGGKANMLFQLGDAANGHQDRPFAMLGVNEINKLFIGTLPTYGKIGGAFVVYDPVTENLTVYTDAANSSFSPGQSFVSLAYKDGKVFIGTSIDGGLNCMPATTEGKLIIWNYVTGEKEFETVPVPGKRSVQGLIVGPDGNIWGMAGGSLFLFDPQKQSIIYNDSKLPAGSDWRDAFLTVGTDGHVYGTAAGKMFQIDAVTKKMTIIMDNDVFGLAQDDYGNLYTRNASTLFQYRNPDLVLKPIGAEIEVSLTTIKGTETAQIKLTKGLLEKSRTTKDVSGASIQYMNGNPDVLSVTDGVITGLKAGKSDVWAKVTLNGITVESDKVTVTVRELQQ